MDVAIGVDSHKQTLEAAALDHVGKPFAARRFSNDLKGHRVFLRWVEGMQGELVVGIECFRHLRRRARSVPVGCWHRCQGGPGNLSFRVATAAGRGTSDPIDAVAIARVVLREPHLPVAKDGTHEDLKLLSDQRDRLISKRTGELSRIHSFMVVARPGYHASLGSLKKEKGLLAVTRMLRRDHNVRA